MKAAKQQKLNSAEKMMASLASAAQVLDEVLTKEQKQQARLLYRVIELECNSRVNDPLARAYAITLAGVMAFDGLKVGKPQ